jgi:hypothetical protein
LATVKPKLCFYGHHHYRTSKVYEGVTCEGLEYGWLSYCQFDPNSFSYELKKV